MELLHPGVYIQEIPSGVRPIEGVSTSNAAFIGRAQMGPLNTAVLVTSLAEFEPALGTFLSDGFLAHSVFQFFNNGGRKCYIVRIAGTGARPAQITIKDRKATAANTMVIAAASPGEWGNLIDVAITDSVGDRNNLFTLSVFRDRSSLTPPQPPLLLETHDNLSMVSTSPDFVERVVNGRSRYIRVTADAANLASAGAGTSRSGRLPVGNGADLLRLVAGVPNGATQTPGTAGPPPTAGRTRGGDNPTVNPPADRRKLSINLNGDGAREITLPSEADNGAAIAGAIQAAVRGLVANAPTNQSAYSGFTATFETPPAPAAPFFLLTSGQPGANSSVVVTNATVPAGNGATLLGLGAAHGGTETAGTAGPPPTGGVSRSADNPATTLSADSRRITINIDGDGPRDITIGAAAATGAAIAADMQATVRALAPNAAANAAAYTGFTATFETPAVPAQPFYRLTSGSTGAASRVVVTDTVTPATGISLPAGPARFVIDMNRDGPHPVLITGPLNDGTAIAAAIQTAVRAILPNRAANAGAFNAFSATYDNAAGAGSPALVLTSGAAGPASTAQITNATSDNVATTLRLGSTNGGTEIGGSAVLRPANSQTPTEYHLGDAQVTGNVAAVLAGNDGLPPVDNDYKNGLTALDVVRDVNIVAVPGVASADVVSSGVNYCTQRTDCFFIGDVGRDDDSVDDGRAFIASLTTKTSYGAVYYPWLRMADPLGVAPQPILVPPSGFVAGTYARIDSRRGVFKAPAGTEANVAGAIGLGADTTDVQQDFLNPIGLNVIRSFPASGLVIWGSRTLATRLDPEYRYIPVRRLAIFLEQSIYNGIQFAVFEPNDEPLWSSLRLNIGAFMMLQFRAGAFQGKSANDAFFVKCDATTTTQQDIDAGRVNILVGFAPLKPAEFVVLQLTQKAGQPAA
jgi:phage tail sheath protein FI